MAPDAPVIRNLSGINLKYILIGAVINIINNFIDIQFGITVITGEVMVVFKPFKRPFVAVVTLHALQDKFLIFFHGSTVKKPDNYIMNKVCLNAMGFY